MTGTKRERAIRAGYDACGGRLMPSNAVIVFAEAFHAVMSKPEPVDGGNIAGGTVTGVETEMAEAELCERGFGLGEWEVWAIDGDGAIVTATFAGAGAESRAEEYAVAKYGGFERRAPDRQQPERYRRTVVRLVKGSVEGGELSATDAKVEAMAEKLWDVWILSQAAAMTGWRKMKWRELTKPKDGLLIHFHRDAFRAMARAALEERDVGGDEVRG